MQRLNYGHIQGVPALNLDLVTHIFIKSAVGVQAFDQKQEWTYITASLPIVICLKLISIFKSPTSLLKTRISIPPSVLRILSFYLQSIDTVLHGVEICSEIPTSLTVQE